jgi:formate-dependent nitrite reductase membrane component NrfD
MQKRHKIDWLWSGSRILALLAMGGLGLVLLSDYKVQEDQVTAPQLAAGLILLASLLALIFLAFDLPDGTDAPN